MKISQKGLYALQAMMMLARHYNQGAIRIRDVAYEEELPEKFLELILLELKNARMVESVRGAKGGYRLRRAPSEKMTFQSLPSSWGLRAYNQKSFRRTIWRAAGA